MSPNLKLMQKMDVECVSRKRLISRKLIVKQVIWKQRNGAYICKSFCYLSIFIKIQPYLKYAIGNLLL